MWHVIKRSGLHAAGFKAQVYTALWDCRASLVAQRLKRPPAMRETWVRSLGWEDPLEKVGKIPWRRKWQPTPVFLAGEPQGRQSLVGCRLWGRTESDTTEATAAADSCLPLKPNLQAQLRGPANLQALAESLRAPQTTVCALPQVGTCPGPSHRLPQACAIQEHKPCYPRKGWSRSQPQSQKHMKAPNIPAP